ncbi:unnamed protein product, partial [Prorocentrum cordatum]
DAGLVYRWGDVSETELDLVTQGLGKHCEIAAPGPDEKDDKIGFLLNRPATWEGGRLLRGCDPRRIELAFAELGLVGATPKSTRGAKVTKLERKAAKPLPPAAMSADRSAAARIGYISHAPAELNLTQLKHIGGGLVGTPRVALEFRAQARAEMATALEGTDYGGCPIMRRSSLGGVVLDGVNPLMAWSVAQAISPPSCGENELRGCVKACAEGFGVISGFGDLGEQKALRVGVDSSAALGVARRICLGKLKHIDARYLWAQHARNQNRLAVFKVLGASNGANPMTKYVDKSPPNYDM